MKTKFILISLLCFFGHQILRAQIITTVAGGDTSFLGNGGPALNAQIQPRYIAGDGAGNIYFSDGDDVIRKISTSGVITTVAGGGTVTPVDGTNALNASLFFESMAVDSLGNIYITHESYNKVIKINTSGIITIVAGNGDYNYSGDGSVATATGIPHSVAVSVDRSGNIYICDAGDGVIRKVDTSGIITTVAGNGTFGSSGDGGPAIAAQLYLPTKITTDKLGNLFIYEYQTDFNGTEIRKVNAAGIISTIAKVYLNGMSADDAGNLYIASDKIYKLDTSGVISTIAGTGTSGFSGDGGTATSAQIAAGDITIDNAANIYLSDGGNKRIRKINTSNIINTIAGNGLYQFSGDGGKAVNAAISTNDVATDRFGNFYTADFNNIIRKVNSSGIINTIAGNKKAGFSGDSDLAINAQLNRPLNAAVDSIGNLYINDAGNFRIRKVNTSGVITTIAGNGLEGYLGDSGAATLAQIAPVKITVSKSGSIYFTQKNNVRKIDINGIITTIAGTGTFGYSGDDSLATNAKLRNPTGITVDDSENVYITDYTNRIRKISSAGIITTIAGNGTDGYSGDGGLATAASLSLSYESGIATDRFSNIFIADAFNSVVRQVDKAGIITTVAGNNTNGYTGDGGQATSAELYYPAGLATDTMGNLYIAQVGKYSVIRFVNFGRSLPLSILSFNGNIQNKAVLLQWQSANEINTKNFIIQRSANGSAFSDLGKVKSANTTGTNAYNFTDNNPLQSISYYRLQMEDNDGRFTYSNIIPIKIGGLDIKLSVYPNPAHNTATVLFNSIGNNKYAINITDLTGRLIKHAEGVSIIGTNTIGIDIRNFSKGTYFINMNNADERISIKFNKQ